MASAPIAQDFGNEKNTGPHVIQDGPIEGVATMHDETVRRMSVIDNFVAITDGMGRLPPLVARRSC
jgi:hypothetical protein